MCVCVCVLQVENTNTSCIQLIIHWLLKQTYHKVHYRSVTTLCLRCKHQLRNTETLGILFWKPARCKYSPNDPRSLYECLEVPYYNKNAAPSAMTRTHRSLIGFRQNTILRNINRGTFHGVLNLPALPHDKDKYGEFCKKHIRFAMGMSWKFLSSQSTTHNFWKSNTLSTHFSVYRPPSRGVLRHSSSQKLSKLTESQVWIPRS